MRRLVWLTTLALATASGACDSLEARRDPAVDTSTYDLTDAEEAEACDGLWHEWVRCLERLRPSVGRVEHDEVVACRVAHARRLAEDTVENPLPEPDRVLDCARPEACVVTAALGPPTGDVEPETPALRHNLRVEVTVEEALLPWSRGGRASATVAVRDADSGAVEATGTLSPDTPFVAELLLPEDRRWEVVAATTDVDCHGGVGGQVVLASAFRLDGPRTLALELDASQAARVPVTLRLADDRPTLASLVGSQWSILAERTDSPPIRADDVGYERIYVGPTGTFQLELFEGTYDVYAERLDEVVERVSACESNNASSVHRFGKGRVARGVVVEAGRPLDLVLAPVRLDLDFVVRGHLPMDTDLDLALIPVPGSSGGRVVRTSLDFHDDGYALWSWPGVYDLTWEMGYGDAWLREQRVVLERDEHLTLEVGAHELTVAAELGARAGWVRELAVTITTQRGTERIDPGDTFMVAPGTYDIGLAWGMRGGRRMRDPFYTGLDREYVSDLVVDRDVTISLDGLPLDARARFEWIAPEPEPEPEPDILDDDGELDADTDVMDASDVEMPFEQEPPEESVRVLLVDPVRESNTTLVVFPDQWERTTLATAHLFTGVYDVLSTDDASHRWPLAACLAIDGGEPALVPWQPRLRRVTLELDGLDTRKPLEIEYRLLSAVELPTLRWASPRKQLYGAFTEPPALYVAPGLYEIAGHQDWGGGQLEPFILEVR